MDALNPRFDGSTPFRPRAGGFDAETGEQFHRVEFEETLALAWGQDSLSRIARGRGRG
jgi:hypothetical protein